IDGDPFEATLDGATLTLRGPVCSKLGVSVNKHFALHATRGAMSIRYVVENHTTTPIAVAPWEVTRVHATGLTFFPTGRDLAAPRPITGLRTQSSITWFE